MASSSDEPVMEECILLSPDDNVLISPRDLRCGETIVIDGMRCLLDRDVPLGHKIARRALHRGDKVIRYGAPIGSLTVDVAPGAHVHSHNLASDYIPAHGRGGTTGGNQP